MSNDNNKDSTPKLSGSTIKDFFHNIKRKTPPSSSSSSEGSQTRPTIKLLRTDSAMANVRKNIADALLNEESDSEQMTTDFDEKITKLFAKFKEEIMDTVKSSLRKMQESIDGLKERVEACEMEVKDNSSIVKTGQCNCEQEIKRLKIDLNRQAQYSRAYNVRIFGVEETVQEDVCMEVTSLIGGSLGVKIKKSDIAAAHRLPSTNKDRPKPIIVRFYEKEVKFQVLKVRKKLKGTGKSITEDMTIDNVKLVNRAENSGVFTSVWFSNGRVHATDHKKKHRILELFETFGVPPK